MKQSTRKTLTFTLITALAIGVATAVFAGPYGPGWHGHRGMMGGPGCMGGMGGGPGMMKTGTSIDQIDQRLADLKTSLGITPDQESAWDNYAQAVEGKFGLMQAHRASMVTSGPPSPEQRQAFHQEGFAQMQKVRDARQDLYQVLTPDQQAKAGNLIGLNRCRH